MNPIASERVRIGLSQEGLASKLDLKSRATIAAYESGGENPQLKAYCHDAPIPLLGRLSARAYGEQDGGVMPDDSKRHQGEKPKTAREVAFDTMCSTIKQAYREWEKGEKKTA